MKLAERVTLVEVGLRDGLQNEKTLLDAETKLGLLRDILDSGVKVLEVGSFVRPDRMPQMAATGELFRTISAGGYPEDAEYRALIPNYKGLENAIASGCKSVKIGVSASRTHNLKNYNRTPEESIAAFESIFAKAKECGVSVIGTVQMAFGSPWDGDIPLEDIASIVKIYDEFGITKVGLGDTASMANPKKVYRTCSELSARFPRVRLKAHFHDARGLGLSNVMAAMEAGITEFDAAFAGLGGCPFVPKAAGNIATEDLVNLFNELGVETGIDIKKTIAIGRKVEELAGHPGRSAVLVAGTAEDLMRRMDHK